MMLVPTFEHVKNLPLHELALQFNRPCEMPGCWFTTHATPYRYCTAHQRYYDELLYRARAFERGLKSTKEASNDPK